MQAGRMLEGLGDGIAFLVLTEKLQDALLGLAQLSIAVLEQPDPLFVPGQGFLETDFAILEFPHDAFEIGQGLFKGSWSSCVEHGMHYRKRPGSYSWPTSIKKFRGWARTEDRAVMPLTLEQYADYLDSRDLPWPAAPEVKRPKAKPHLVPLAGVRLVTWNLYGTLLSVSGGELLFEHPQKFVMDLALDKTVQEFKMWGSMSRKPGQPAEYMGQLYQKALTEQRMAPSPGEKHPEIQSDKVWDWILKKLMQKDYKFDAGFFGSMNEYCKKIAYFFHASLQGTAAQPNAAAALLHVHSCGVKQCLVADAQCFSTVQLQRALRAAGESVRLDEVVDSRLHALSFEVKARKPSERLFRHTLALAARAGIEPGQVLHIGARVAQDIAPAKRLGLRTALYAGDKEALQATPEQLKDPAQRPDVLLTDLAQIKDVVSP